MKLVLDHTQCQLYILIFFSKTLSVIASSSTDYASSWDCCECISSIVSYNIYIFIQIQIIIFIYIYIYIKLNPKKINLTKKKLFTYISLMSNLIGPPFYIIIMHVAEKIHLFLRFSFRKILNFYIILIEVQEINKSTCIKTNLYNIITLKTSIYIWFFLHIKKIQRILTQRSCCKAIFHSFIYFFMNEATHKTIINIIENIIFITIKINSGN